MQAVITVGLMLVALSSAANVGGREPAHERTFVGYAYDRTTDALLYKELHSEVSRVDGGVDVQARYVAPNGETIATYSAEASDDPLVPEVRFEDARWGTLEGVRHQDGAIVLFRKRSGSRDGVDEKQPDCADRPVADAGLDHLVSDHWEQLLGGERVVAELLIPQRLRCLRFSLLKTDEWSLDGEPVVTIEMAFTNPLIRLLAGSLRFTYHREHRFMVRFEGKSRLVDESGDNYVVRVDFPIAERTGWVSGEHTTSIGGSDG
jgi:hypothetical protein